jgi:hypothetical protein
MNFFFEVHYLSIEKKIAIKHKQHSEIHFEFKPWDGRQIVNTESAIMYFGLKSRPKYNKTNTNKVCSFKSI